ncbi:MAG: cell division protein FtsZ [Oscillospiraceae bacterium]|jgi:cell division protein FtsZ|nr:cell division protein FtsZ [Oscillospiraceae bacterium]
MPNDFIPGFEEDKLVDIKIIGVGGAGGNAVDCMIETGIDGVEYIAINTDRQALDKSQAPTTLQIGAKITKGRGAGTIPERAKEAAVESKEEIQALLKNTTMLFIAAGEGGGTGTGASPVIAEIAKEMGILIVAVVTLPFSFEGAVKKRQAEKGIEELRKYVDSLIVIPNDNLRQLNKETKVSFKDGFKNADKILTGAVKSIADLVAGKGYVNVDFADVEMTLKNAGICHLTIGTGTGKDKVKEAVESVITNPLLTTSINGAKRVLINICLSDDISFEEVSEFIDEITEKCDEEAVIKWGAIIDEEGIMQDRMEVTVITAGYEDAPEEEKIIKINNPALSGQKSPTSSITRTPRPAVTPLNNVPTSPKPTPPILEKPLAKTTDSAPPPRPKSGNPEINDLFNELFGDD